MEGGRHGLIAIHATVYTIRVEQPYRVRRKRAPGWDAERVRALREHLGLTQQELAAELNVRQQTVSEWETRQYRPRGASERLLSMVAERTGFTYDTPGGGR
jgi:DNA-binding transcriptional regulator YiaG